MSPKKAVAEQEATEEVRPKGTQSLYNKYRPKTFAQVVGQDKVVSMLQNAIATGRGIPHSLLMTGPRGCGKTTTARIVAAALNCPNEKDGEPCAECGTCVAILSGNMQGSVHELNAADNRGIGDMRDLLSNINLAPQTAFKVYIIDEVHMLTNEGASMLLKYVEEPPLDNIVFILATTDPEKLLPTINSRATVCDFKLIEKDVLKQLVLDVCEKEELEVTDSEVDQVVTNGRGSARDTLSQLQVIAMGGHLADNKEAAELIPKIIRGVVERDMSSLLVAIATSDKNGSLNARVAAEELLVFFRDVLLYKSAPDLVFMVSDLEQPMKRAASEMADHTVIRNMEVVSDALQKMRSSGSGRIALEGCLARIIVDPAGDQYAAVIEMMRKQGHTLSVLRTAILEMAESLKLSSKTTDSVNAEDVWSKKDDDRQSSSWPSEEAASESPAPARAARRRRGGAAAEPERDQAEEAEEKEVVQPRRRRRAAAVTEEAEPAKSDESEETAEAEDTPKAPRRRRRAAPEPEAESDKSEESSDEPDTSDSSESSMDKSEQPSEDAVKQAELFEEALDQVSGRNKSLIMEGDWSHEDGHYVIVTDVRLSQKTQDKIISVLGEETEFKIAED